MILEVDKAIKQFHEDCKSLGQAIMDDHNNVPMTIALLTQNEDKGFAIGIAPEIGFLYDPDDKSNFLNSMRKMIKTLRPIAIGIISEAWMVKRAADEDYDFDIPVRDQEDREEVLMIQIETYKTTSLVMYNIEREGDKVHLTLNEEQSNIDKKNVAGMFSMLLKENYEHFSKEIEENLKKNVN